MISPTLLIGGGYDKDSEYEEWINSFEGKVKKLVLIGQTKEKIAKAASSCGFNDYIFADTLEEAILICKENAVPGDAVLLSPACASWGMFKNYLGKTLTLFSYGFAARGIWKSSRGIYYSIWGTLNYDKWIVF